MSPTFSVWIKKKKIPVRLILAVAAGIIPAKIMDLLTHHVLHTMGIFPALGNAFFNRDKLTLALAIHSFYAVAGAMLTAHIAREKSSKAIYILGTKEAILWLLGIALLWNHHPPWFPLTKAILGMPLALLGAKIYAMMKSKKRSSAAFTAKEPSS